MIIQEIWYITVFVFGYFFLTIIVFEVFKLADGEDSNRLKILKQRDMIADLEC